jgi:von Willebrand factor type A domain
MREVGVQIGNPDYHVKSARDLFPNAGPFPMKAKMTSIWCSIVLFASAGLCAAPLRAQQDPCMQRSLPVYVLTSDGGAVTGLGPTNFEGSYRQKPVHIVSAAIDGQPRRVLLLLDSSGSMFSSPRDDWNLALHVAGILLTQFPPQTPIGVAVFADRMDRAVGLTTDRQQVEQELAELRAGRKLFPAGPRSTALWDAIRGGLAMFGTPQQGDVIYVITDGQDDSSRTEPTALERMLLSAGVRVFALELFDAGFPRGKSHGTQDFIEFVTTTGGFALSPTRAQNVGSGGDSYALTGKSGQPTRLRMSLALQLQQIMAFERLDIELPEPLDKPHEWDLKVTNLGELKTRSVSVIYPRKLLPCSATAAK